MGSARPPSSSGSNPTQPLSSSSSRTLARAAEVAGHVGEYRYVASGTLKHRPLAPLLPITLQPVIQQPGLIPVSTYAKIDTGADITTLDADWAPQLGINLEHDCTRQEVGAASDQPVYHYCYADGLTIKILGEDLFLPLVMFCKRKGIALLGRYDFFQRYLVLIDEPHKRFFLERLPDPVDDDEDDERDLDALAAS